MAPLPPQKDSTPASDLSVSPQLMTRWVASIADKVKNPLSGVSSTLKIIEQELEHLEESPQETRTRIQGHIEKIDQRLDKLYDYIDELLRFSDPVTLSLQNYAVQDLLKEAIETWKKQQRSGDATINVMVQAGIQTIRCDKVSVVKSFVALFANALEAIPAQQGPRIQITISQDSSGELGKNTLLIAVEDNGVGFLQQGEPAVFLKPFYSTKETGTGLGLSIVQKYVKAHGGMVRLENSRALGGAKVSILLPQ